MTAQPHEHLHRCGAPAGAGPPRVRGLRGAAGDGDPARRLPGRQPAAAGARARRAAGRHPGHAARGDRRAATGGAGRDQARPRRRLDRDLAGAEAASPAAAKVSAATTSASGSTRSSSGASSSPAPPTSLPATTSPRPTATGSPRPRQPSTTRRARRAAPAGRLAPPPHDRLPERVSAAAEAVTSVQSTLDSMLGAIPALKHQHRPLAPPAPPDLPRHRRGSSRPRPQGDGGPLRRHRRAAPRPDRMRHPIDSTPVRPPVQREIP